MNESEERLRRLGQMKPIEAGPVGAIEERGHARRSRRRRTQAGASAVAVLCLVAGFSLVVSRGPAKSSVLVGSEGGDPSATTPLSIPSDTCNAAPNGNSSGTLGNAPDGEAAAAAVAEVTGEGPAVVAGDACRVEMQIAVGTIEYRFGPADPADAVALSGDDISISGLPGTLVGRLSHRGTPDNSSESLVVAVPGETEGVYVQIDVPATTISSVTPAEIQEIAVHLLARGPFRPS
jgi:hypothetical protein